jgi:hypothetical protein
MTVPAVGRQYAFLEEADPQHPGVHLDEDVRTHFHEAAIIAWRVD